MQYSIVNSVDITVHTYVWYYGMVWYYYYGIITVHTYGIDGCGCWVNIDDDD